jgi:hypothetical protein
MNQRLEKGYLLTPLSKCLQHVILSHALSVAEGGTQPEQRIFPRMSF